MAKLSENEWSIISDIILEINRTTNEQNLLLAFFEKLKGIISFDHGAFFLGQNEGNNRYLTNPVMHTPSSEQANVMQSSLYQYEKCRDVDYVKWMYSLPNSSVYRETDILNNPLRENTDMFKKIYKPMNLHYCAGINMVFNNILLGNASIFRHKENKNFTKRDLDILEYIQPHLTYRIYQIHPQSKNQLSVRSAIGDEHNLTPREVDIIGLICRGLSNNEIGQRLFISDDTVKKHIYHIYKKMNIRSRTKLINIFNENNYNFNSWY